MSYSLALLSCWICCKLSLSLHLLYLCIQYTYSHDCMLFLYEICASLRYGKMLGSAITSYEHVDIGESMDEILSGI